ncbi:MAG: NifU N-terminal domain-containing protein [Phycisphaerae bacterium]|nr:NifU N-terminal domain-containing protein [Phycisphaerae bacterium]
MTLRVTRFEPTPNPDALKAVLTPADHPALPVAPATRWYPNDAAAAADPLARAVAGVPGVAAVLLGAGWLTVTRRKGQAWSGLRRSVEQAVASCFEGNHP